MEFAFKSISMHPANDWDALSTLTTETLAAFAYCFATPAGADKSNNPNSEKYNSIFNIVHYYDPVPLVAPAYWNFDRYGRTYIFPFSGSLKDASIYEKNMLKVRIFFIFIINCFWDMKSFTVWEIKKQCARWND